MPVDITSILDESGKPASLTPEEQAELNAMAQSTSLEQLSTSQAATTVEAPRLLSAYEPPQFHDEQGAPAKLTPAERAEARKQANVADPLLDLTPEEMAEFARKQPEQFNILQALQARPDAKEDPAAVSRIAKAWKLYRDQTGIQDLKISNIPENIWGMAKGLFSYGKDMPSLSPTQPLKTVQEVQGLLKLVESGDITPEQLEHVRGLTENVYATALSLEGLARQGKNLLGRMTEEERKLKLPGLPSFGAGGRPEADRDIDKLFEDEAVLEGTQALATGKRELLPGLGKLTSFLESKGAPLRPEKIQEKAAGDPLTFYLFGKVFGAMSKAAPTVLSEQALARAGGATAAGVGKAAEVTGKVGQTVIPPVAAVLPVAGAIKGGLLGGSVGSVTGGVAAGYGAGRLAAAGLRSRIPTMAALESAGKQIAGKTPVVSPYAQLAKSIAEGTPAAAYEVGKGLAADVALTFPAETPEEMQGIGIGAAFGLFGAGTRMGGHVLSGQIVGPREYGVAKPVRPRGLFPSLDAISNRAYEASPDGVKTRVNAVRGWVHTLWDNGEFIYAPRPEAGQPDPLVTALTGIRDSQGNPVVSEAQAKLWAGQEGVFSKDVGGRKLIIARDVESAPHEASGHGLEDVLGESTMRQIDAMIQADPKYSGQALDAIAQDYASRVKDSSGKPLWDQATPWQDFLLTISKWGRDEAKEKLVREQTGVGPYTPEAAEKLWADRVAASGGDEVSAWKSVLTPEEQDAAARRYMSREIFAENADASFKHGAAPDAAIADKIARVIGNFVRYIGGEPLAGRTSEGLGIPLSLDVVQAHRRGTRGVVAARGPVVEPKGRPAVTPRPAGGIPSTPEQQSQAAEDARLAAANAPSTPLAAGGTKSAREILGTIAESIANRAGVKINYSSAPDEPAASITSNRKSRREIIEAFRSMPAEARALWEKSFFPERVLSLKNGGYQVLGWSPEVFAANAHKTALALSDMIANDPAYARLSPYPIDPKTGSFTPEGWQQLYADTQTFVQNQISGRTGSGVPLVIPKEMRETGAFAPPLQLGAPLEQGKSDFISSLYSFKLPETARITGGRMPLSIVGAEVSEATIPGRTVEPVRPRPEFEGPKAEALGIEGRPILEVNPFRNALETAAKDTGVPLPSLIESIQRLNLESIKEVAAAPELPQFRGNTLTLTAGFMPSDNPRAIRAAAVRDRRTGREFIGSWHGDALIKAMDAGLSDRRADYLEGFVTNTPGEFLDRDQGTARGIELGQIQPELAEAAKVRGAGIEHLTNETLMAPEWGKQLPTPGAEPVPEIQDLVRQVHQTTAEQWQSLVRSPEARGASSYAHQAGMRARTPADLALLKSTYELLADLGAAALKAREPQLALEYGVKKQAVREAYEAATGRTMDGTEDVSSTIRQLHDPNYTPPVPPRAQFEPKNFSSFEAAKKDLKPEMERLTRLLQSTPLESRHEVLQQNKAALTVTHNYVGKDKWGSPEDYTLGFNVNPDTWEVGVARFITGETPEERFDYIQSFAPVPALTAAPAPAYSGGTRFYAEPVELSHIKIPEKYTKNADDFDTSNPAWITPEGTKLSVPGYPVMLFHSESAKGLSDFNPLLGLSVEDFQHRTGSMRLATMASPKALEDTGGEDLAIAVSKKPTAAQLEHVKRYLDAKAQNGELSYSYVLVDVQDPTGKTLVSRGFDNVGKISRGQILRFLSNPEFPKSPASAQFQSRTERGQELEKEGFQFSHTRDRFGNRRIVLTKHGQQVGEMVSKLTDPETESVRLVKIEPEFQGQKLSEALYRELAAQLQDEGISNLTGEVVHRAPLHIREKLFGAPEDIEPEFESESGFMRVVKSKIPAGAQFEPAREERGPDYYSQLGRVIAQKFSGASMPAEQLAAILRNPQNGVKPEEIAWTGLDDYLREHPRVSKAEVQEFLRENQVQIKEISRGGEQPVSPDLLGYLEQNTLPTPATSEEWTGLADHIEGRANQARSSGQANRLWRLRQEAVNRSENLVGDTGVRTGTKFESYQLPGGENYREVLLTLPNKPSRISPSEYRVEEMDYGRGKIGYFVVTPNSRSHAYKTRAAAERALSLTPHFEDLADVENQQFKSSHFDEPNVLVHARVNDRTDSTGAPGLFAEEIQSDWHQKGRKQGYQQRPEVSPIEAVQPGEAGYSDGYRFKFLDLKVGDYLFFKTEQEAEARSAEWAAENTTMAGVPDAPFKKSWHELAFRRLVRLAAEQGKSWLGWTTGEQQAARYDISKHVDSLSWVQGLGELRAFKGDAEVIHKNGVNDEAALADYIGKEAASKLAAQTPQSNPIHGGTLKSQVRWLEGQDLKVGGEGMRGFYDKILVDYANKFGKKFGARTEDRTIAGDAGAYKIETRRNPTRYMVVDREGNETGSFGSFEEAKQIALDRGAGPVTVHSLPITDAMRRSVLQEGVAQFEPQRYGTPADIESTDPRFKDTFFPIGFTEAKPGPAPTLNTDAARKAESDYGVRLVYHGDKTARNLFAFGPAGEDAGSAFSRQISPTEAVVYTSRGEGALAGTLRDELTAQLEKDGLTVAKGAEPQAQFIFGLEGIEKLNRKEVERQERQAEQETTRLSSFAGDIRSGLVLHSAKQRSTVHLTPQESQKFMAAYRGAETPQEKSSVVEQYFAEGSALGVQFTVGQKLLDEAAQDRESGETPKSPGGLPKILTLVHYSQQPDLKTADPKRLGTGRATQADLSGGPKTFFFVKNSPLGADEGLFQKSFAYTAKIPSAELYNAGQGSEDPLGFFGPNRLAAEARIKRAGYSGVFVDTADGRQVVITFGKTPVTLLGRAEQLGHTAIGPATPVPGITGPAIRVKGKVFTEAELRKNVPGEYISDVDALVKLGVLRLDRDWVTGEGYPVERGYVTGNRKFVPQSEAFQPSVQFEPGDELRAHAVKDREGNIFEAKGAHYLAEDKARREGGVPFEPDATDPGLEPGDEWMRGYTNRRGNFLTRQQVVDLITARKISGEFQAQFTPARLEDFNDEKSIGAALARTGWAVLSGTQESLGSADAPANVANNAALEKLLTAQGYEFQKITGTYKGIPQGESFLVTGIDPESALALGNQFKQESVLVPEGLLFSDKTLNPAMPTETRTGAAAEAQEFFSTTPGGASFSMGLDFSRKIPFEPSAQFTPERREGGLLPGIGIPKVLAPSELAGLTKAEVSAHYPEAVIPRRSDEPIPSAIVDSPLAKSSNDPVAAFSRRLVDFAKEYQDHPSYQSGLRWYSEFVPKLKKVFGKDSPVMAELLAGTSPQQPPGPNYAMALDAYQGWKSGRFDKQIAGFERGLDKIKDGSWQRWLDREISSGALENPPDTPTEATFIDHWVNKNNLLPRQSNGKLYGISSDAVLKILARRWLENTSGLKTQNFVRNLLGIGHEATIDLWADRTMRRLGYSDAKARWRILPKNATGVSDADFVFSQKAFRAAARALGVKPDALQGGLWFAEKQLWADNGWGRLDLGDYRREIEKTELLKTGIEQRLAAAKASRRARPQEQLGLDIVEPRATLNP